jgi:hypothetical protein
MKKQDNGPFSQVSNDTLIMTLWCIRQDDLSPDVRLRYESLLNEVIERKNKGLMPLWAYMLPIINNDLSHLSDVDNDYVNALISPVFLVG